ncbi:MAG: tetratricopeptide repeat protein, partial [Myxococcales bacterium]|nr:tetratricopeptide repeat protein [Myxococcales bacterium]
GTEAGSRIPDHGLPLRDELGHIIVSQRNIQRLERLATATDGVVFSADAWGSIDGAELNSAVRRDAGNTPGAPVERRVRAVRVAPLAALAFGLMLIEALQPLRLRIRRKRSPARRAALATAIIAIATLGIAPPTQNTTLNLLEAQLRHHPGDVRLLVELGLARLERGRQQAAQRAFLAAALSTSDPELAALAYYNLGVAALEEGSYDVARDAFFDALALRPGDRRARFNLEWSLAALSAETHKPDSKSSRRLATERKLGAPRRPEEEPETTEAGRSSETETSPQPLDPERRDRWLARVQDDPAAALRSVARASGRALQRKRIVW